MEQAINNGCESKRNSADFSHPADLAEHLKSLSPQRRMDALRKMEAGDAADALAEMDDSMAATMLENMDASEAARIIAEMDPDDAADVLDDLDVLARDALLENMTKEESEELRHLLHFDPDSAAGVMNTEIVLLESSMSIDDAIAHIRQEMREEKETPYYAYVVDEHDILLGVLSIRDLMLAAPGAMVGNLVAWQNVVSVTWDTDKEEVAKLLSRYNYLTMPVVDYEGHIMGAVTYDDIMDIIHEEASADMLGMVGADPEESWDTPWRESVARRLPWLVVNLLNSALSASVVYMFEGTIAQMAILAVLMPMVANQAGNTGQQALAVMIRQLARDRFDPKQAWRAVLREGKIGMATGLAMALISFLGAWWFTGNELVGLVMGGAILCDMLLGALAGASIPLVFRWLGRDPAQASSIFLTTLTDGAGFFIFLGLATLFLF